MCGFFGDLFDFNHDGKLDFSEEMMEFMLLEELMQEDEESDEDPDEAF